MLVLALLADEAEAQARVVAARAAPVLSAPEVASLIEANVGEETAPRFFEFVASSGA